MVSGWSDWGKWIPEALIELVKYPRTSVKIQSSDIAYDSNTDEWKIKGPVILQSSNIAYDSNVDAWKVTGSVEISNMPTDYAKDSTLDKYGILKDVNDYYIEELQNIITHTDAAYGVTYLADIANNLIVSSTDARTGHPRVVWYQGIVTTETDLIYNVDFKEWCVIVVYAQVNTETNGNIIIHDENGPAFRFEWHSGVGTDAFYLKGYYWNGTTWAQCTGDYVSPATSALPEVSIIIAVNKIGSLATMRINYDGTDSTLSAAAYKNISNIKKIEFYTPTPSASTFVGVMFRKIIGK